MKDFGRKMPYTVHKYHYRTKSRLLLRVLREFVSHREVFLRDLRMIAGSAFYDVVWPKIKEVMADLKEDFPDMSFIVSGTAIHGVSGQEQVLFRCVSSARIELKEEGSGVSYLGRYTVVIEERD